ncbi:MAG: hypothetical protein ACLT76_01285 [Clostridium fessum]
MQTQELACIDRGAGAHGRFCFIRKPELIYVTSADTRLRAVSVKTGLGIRRFRPISQAVFDAAALSRADGTNAAGDGI